MMTDEFETDLRAALAQCADDVPPHIGGRLRQHNYHARGRRRRLVSALGAAVVGVGLGAVGFVIGTGSTVAHQPTHRAAPPVASGSTVSGQSMRLADVTIPLPAGFKPTETACVPAPGGLQFVGTSFATAASESGGCMDVFLVSSASAPASSVPVTVGDYPGSLVTDASTGITTLYVAIPADLYIHTVSPNGTIDSPATSIDLVLTATGLSINQVESIAAAGIPSTPIGPAGACSGACG